MSHMSRRGQTRLITWTLGTMVLALTLPACASRTRTTPAMEETDWEVQVESPLDTLQVPPGGAAGLPFPAGGDTAGTAEGAVAVNLPPAPAEPVVVPDPRDFAPGWRVQIAALSSMATAEQVAEEARSRFEEPVYVEYEPPLYKVRVGDFLIREEAESLKTRAHAQDYEKAWVVETLVLKPAR